MKKKIIMLALAVCLVSAPAVEAAVTAEAENAAMGIDAAKKPQKKTTKKTTKKSTKTTKKSTATTAKTTTKATTANTATTAASQEPAQPTTETKTATTQSATTGSSVLGSILGGILGAGTQTQTETSSSDSGNGILSALSSIFDLSKIARKSDLVGTWTYTEPAVVFTSDNVLNNIGGKVASETIEKQLQSQLEKYGIKKGAMQMTFDKNGNFTQTVAGKTLSGTYTVSGKNVNLKYAGQVQQIVGTTQIDGNDLLIVMDASKLLKYANVLGSLTGNSLLNTAGNLLGSMKGMELGLKLNK